MARCFGITRNLHRCSRIGDWKLFCSEHQRQPLAWLFVFVFTVLGGLASMQSAWWPSRVHDSERTNIRNDALTTEVSPMVDLSIGQPFASSTIITLKNSGVKPIIDVAVNLRCLLLEKDRTDRTVLFFEGFRSIGNANSWWTIDQIDPGAIRTKDAMESLARCLHNRKILEESRKAFIFTDMILAVDIVYRHEVDQKEYEMSGIAQLMKDNKTENPFLWPLPMSDFYRHILETFTAPNYRMGSK